MFRNSIWSLVILGLVLTTMKVLSKQITFNYTISEPVGYYFVIQLNNYLVQDKVLVCVVSSKHLSSMHKLGLPYQKLECPNDAPYLLKTIVAKEGDKVEISKSGVLINGELFKSSKAFLTDKGINLYPMSLQKFILAKDEFFVLGDTLNSYDSRYFGIIRKNQVYGKAILVWSVKHD